MFDFSTITQWVDELLRSFLPHAAATLVEFILIGLCLLVGYAVIALVLIYVERKVCAFFQCRLGPNRVGKWGSIQVVCDVLKMLTKEIFMPKGADQNVNQGDHRHQSRRPIPVQPCPFRRDYRVGTGFWLYSLRERTTRDRLQRGNLLPDRRVVHRYRGNPACRVGQ